MYVRDTYIEDANICSERGKAKLISYAGVGNLFSAKGHWVFMSFVGYIQNYQHKN